MKLQEQLRLMAHNQYTTELTLAAADRIDADEALMREVLDAVERACNTAMVNTAKARIPECGDFCGIAQDLEWSCEKLRARLGGV